MKTLIEAVLENKMVAWLIVRKTPWIWETQHCLPASPSLQPVLCLAGVERGDTSLRCNSSPRYTASLHPHPHPPPAQCSARYNIYQLETNIREGKGHKGTGRLASTDA